MDRRPTRAGDVVIWLGIVVLFVVAFGLATTLQPDPETLSRPIRSADR